MSVTVDMRGILLPNGTSPTYASNYKNGDRGTGTWQLTAGHYQGYITPTIAYPRPDSETLTTARHRVNYTGQNYRIPVAVNGGAWPFYYELLAFPSGMTIGNQLSTSGGELVAGADYGVITYPNAVAGTYTVTVRVTDQNGVVNTVSWQLVVDTNNWVFLDPSAGTNGSGTLASPYNTLASLNGLTTKKVLIRTGTVDWEQKVVGLQSMPVTYINYGSETVYMKQAMSPIGCNGGRDYGFFGMKFFIPSDRTNVNQFFRLDGGPDCVVFFDCEFDGGSYDNTDSVGFGGDAPKSNSSVLFWQGQAVAEASTTNSWYSVIKNCTFKNIRDRDLYLGYSMRYAVIEGNSIDNCTVGGNGLGHGFYVKTNISTLTFRGNYSVGTTNTQKLLRIDAYNPNGNFVMDYFDICYNSYRYYGTIEGVVGFCHEFVSGGTHRYLYRNNLWANNAGAAAVYLRGMFSGDLVTLSNNVLVCNGTNTNGVRTDQFDGFVSNTGYVAGNVAAGILDSSNKLAGGYVSNLGTKGAQVA